MASPEVTIELKGLDQLERNLKELGTKIAKKLLKASMKEGAEPVKSDAERRVIRAKGGPTYPIAVKNKKGATLGPGHIADNIIVTSRISSLGVIQIKIGPDKDHWYSNFIEFGTPQFAAQPAFRPALDTKAPQALRIIERVLWDKIEKEVARMRK